MLRIAIDAMGGDFGPEPIVEGLISALKKNNNFKAIAVGKKDQLLQLIPQNFLSRIEILDTDDVISMSDSATDALKRKDSTIYKAIELVREGNADAVVSAGHSGASMSLATLRIGRIKGVSRPAIATLMPTSENQNTLVLDVGANVDSDPEQLLDFAIMGEAYARAITNNESPSIGLLNVGSEDVKGHEDIREAMRLLRECGTELGLNVYGFVEGNDISMGTVDVVVTDGFTGNVALKAAEGAAKLIAKALKDSLKSDIISSLGALIASKGFNKFKDRLDPRSSNGGLLLGLNGIVVKSHGGTDAIGFYNAICVAHKLACSDYKNTVSANLKRLTDIRKNAVATEAAV